MSEPTILAQPIPASDAKRYYAFGIDDVCLSYEPRTLKQIAFDILTREITGVERVQYLAFATNHTFNASPMVGAEIVDLYEARNRNEYHREPYPDELIDFLADNVPSFDKWGEVMYGAAFREAAE